MEIRSKTCEHEILHWMVSIPDSISFQEIAEHSSSPEYGCTATFLDSQIENFTEITYFEEKSTSYFIRKLIEGFCIHVYLHLDCA